MFFYLMTILSTVVLITFAVCSIAAGLFYLAELVEEYTVMAKSVISWAVFITAMLHLGLIIFEDLPFHLNALGLCQQAVHAYIMREFPMIRVSSVSFWAALVAMVVHHYLAFSYFATIYYGFHQTLAYFTLCLWVVPFSLFVSLSANDYVLPTTGESQPLIGDNNVLTDYLSRKSKKYSLLSFFSFAKESILPQRSKKAF